jgi:hypothetical protein
MSFVLHRLHEQQQHAPYLGYSFQDGRNICLACFLHSLSDPGHLDSKKQFAIRCGVPAAAMVVACRLALQQHGSTACPGCDVPASISGHALELLSAPPCYSSTKTHNKDV